MIEHLHSGTTRVVAALAVACFTLVVSGCVINEPDAPPRGVVVSGPPPAPLADAPPARPAADAVWVGGYWHWTGMQYVWIPGHWDRPPPGRQWHKPTYSLQEGRYIYESGGWK